jgi:hypothetical protein
MVVEITPTAVNGANATRMRMIRQAAEEKDYTRPQQQKRSTAAQVAPQRRMLLQVGAL